MSAELIIILILGAVLLFIVFQKRPKVETTSRERMGYNEVEAVSKLVAPRLGVQEENVEVRLFEGSRADFVLDAYVCEVDWAKKWAEGIGQSLYYSLVTGKKPMLVLLTKDLRKDTSHIMKCRTLCVDQGIRIAVYDLKKDKLYE